MRLLLLLAADHANLTADGKLNLLGAFRFINASKFPARHPSMYLIVKLEAELGEYGQTRTLNAKLIHPDGGQVMEVTGTIQVPTPHGGIRPEINAIIELKDIVFPEPGPYQFVILVDKDHKGDFTLHVNKVDMPNAASG